ncbi:MAG: ABC transporter ATP-binding protein, partial [Puniceicoccales bacterium]
TEISRLHNLLDDTMIYDTHDQVEAMTMGDRICVMKDGHIMQVDEPLQLYNNPQTLFVAGFIGSPPMNFFSGHCIIENCSAFFVESSVSGAPGFRLKLDERFHQAAGNQSARATILGIRPEHIEVTNNASEGSIAATIDVSEPMGSETFLYLNTGAQTAFIARVEANHAFTIGETVHLRFEPEKIALFDQATEQVLSYE